MKTKKLNLNNLKVESFVTSLESKDAQTVKGGSSVYTAIANAYIVAVVSVSVAATLVAAGAGVAIGTAINAATNKK